MWIRQEILTGAIAEAGKRQPPVGDRVRPNEIAEEEYSVESGLDARVPGT